MNKVILMGRTTRDPEVRYSQTSTGESMAIARYSLAVDRPARGNNAQRETDFINCVAFGRNAEFAEKYLRKGMKMLVCGRIQTGSYTNREGQKVYTTDIVVEEHYFAESKSSSSQPAPAPQQNAPAYQQGAPAPAYQQGAPVPPYQQGAPAPAYQQGAQAPAYQQPYGVPQQPYGAPNPAQASGFTGGSTGDGFMNIPDGIDEELPFC